MLDLEHRNFENLVTFYSSELKQIQAGNRASKIFSWSERNRLNRYGILITICGSRTSKIKITEKAIFILNAL